MQIRNKELGQEILRYLLVGGCAVVIDGILYFLLSRIEWLGPSWAKRISFIGGACWSYLANKYFTFRKPQGHFTEPFLFGVIYFIGFVLNAAVHDIVKLLLDSKVISFLAATGVSTIWNYLGQKFIVFRKKSTKEETKDA